MGWFFFKPRSVRKVAKAVGAVSSLRADFTLLQEGFKEPWKITPKVIARFENDITVLRNACDGIANFVEPGVFASTLEQVEALETQGSAIASGLRNPQQARVPEFAPFRVALQKIEHLLNEEKKRLGAA